MATKIAPLTPKTIGIQAGLRSMTQVMSPGVASKRRYRPCCTGVRGGSMVTSTRADSFRNRGSATPLLVSTRTPRKRDSVRNPKVNEMKHYDEDDFATDVLASQK